MFTPWREICGYGYLGCFIAIVLFGALQSTVHANGPLNQEDNESIAENEMIDNIVHKMHRNLMMMSWRYKHSMIIGKDSSDTEVKHAYREKILEKEDKPKKEDEKEDQEKEELNNVDETENIINSNELKDKQKETENEKEEQQTTGSKMNQSMKTFFLEMHNFLRREVANGNIEGQPPAADMNKLSWDTELAAKAQIWADQCVAKHDDNASRRTYHFPFVGQNWGGMPTVTKALRRWFQEYAYYDFETQKCQKEPCAHYTQLVWSWATHIGCGVADCSHVEDFPYINTVVCNYGPGGNVLMVRPYRIGPACSACLVTHSNCDQGLCVE